MAKKAWLEVGSIRQAESGKLYIKFHGQNNKEGKFDSSCLKDLAEAISGAGKDGIALQIEKPQDKIHRLNDLGFIDDDKVEGRLDSIPSWLKYSISLPPNKD